MKRTWYKTTFDLIQEKCIGLLTGIVSASNHKKCVFLSHQQCMIQPTLINLHLNEYSQELRYYPFAVKLDALEVVILWMIYLIKYVFQIEQKT